MTTLLRSTFLIFAVLATTLFWLGLAAYSQSPQNAAQKQRMVILNVRVTDSLGRAVTDVPQNDFRIVEDGVPQTISLFSKEDIPLTYTLAIDTSGSLRSQLGKVLAMGITIVSTNQPDDETMVIRFISSDKIETVQEFTSDKPALIRGLQSLTTEAGQSAIFDAVYLTVQSLVKRKVETQLRRRAIILVTDGEERRSYFKRDELFKLLEEADVQIYVVGFVEELRGAVKDKAVLLLNRLASHTGGRVFFPDSTSDLTNIAADITRDVRTQYVIGYVPTNPPGASFHKLQVTLAERPDTEKRIAITRVGYSDLRR